MGAGLRQYRQSIQRCAILLGIGTALQFLCGDIDSTVLHYPWSLVLSLNYIYLLVLLHHWLAECSFLRSLVSRSCCVSLLSLLALMMVWMGLSGIPLQHTWPFCILMCCLMTIVGLTLVDDVVHIRQRSFVRMLSHAGIFLFLAATMFGSADMQKVKVTTQLGHPVQMGYDESGSLVELPFQLTLKRFLVEEYAPMVVLHSPDESLSAIGSFSLSSDTVMHELGNWRIRVSQYCSEAVYNSEKDSVMVMKHVGAAPMAYLQVFDRQSECVGQGWVSSGSFLFTPVTLGLPDGFMLSMNPPKPKSFCSEVWLLDGDNERHRFNILVNHPANYATWHLYQMGYDTERGRWSDISILECVRDPWHPVKQLALWTLLLAALLAVAGKWKTTS
ncbi:MAG: cytochrome c biogenesis protein ResB, partial [Bacteroidales bacterium]|nr:cytochrome c biogenesis protein ResB [Bacteroidales bacterium]